MVIETVCERRLATAVSVPETFDFEVPSQIKSRNAEDFCCLLFQRTPDLGVPTQFREGAEIVRRSGDRIWCGKRYLRIEIEVFGRECIVLRTKARRSD
jgi:hypothetical protein